MKNFLLLSFFCYLNFLFAFEGACKNNNYTANGADVITLKEGTYDIGSLHLENYKNKRLVITGIGKVILTSSDGHGIILDNIAATSLVLENIGFSGERYAITYTNPTFFKDSLIIKDCSFQGCEAALYIKDPKYGINNLIVQNCSVTGKGLTGKQVSSQKGFFAFCPVQNALINNDTISDLNGVKEMLRAIHVGVIGGAFNKYEVSNNLIENITGGDPGEEQGIMVLGEGSAYIHHNTLKNIYHTIPGTNDVEGIYSKCLQTEIAFNTLDDVGDTEASICVKGSQESPLVKTLIHDNTISFSADRDPARQTAGIRCVRTKNLTITNNIIKRSPNSNGAINIKSDMKDSLIENLDISNNQLLDCLGMGIRIIGAAYKKVSINNNTISLSDTVSIKTKNNYAIEFQIIKSSESLQPADFVITNNSIEANRPNTTGIFIVQQDKDIDKRHAKNPGYSLLNRSTINFSDGPKIYNNKIKVTASKLSVDPQLKNMSIKKTAQ